MKDYTKNNNDPVCKFGPGGDFVFAWPQLPQIPAETSNSTHNKPVSATTKDLFGNDLQIPIHTAHKAKPKIRLHRRTPKKSVTYDVSDQGMLFEVEQKTVKTA